MVTGILPFSFAQEATEGEKAEVSLSPDTISKNMPAFMFNLQKYVDKAERNIKKIDDKMRKEAILSSKGSYEHNARIYADMGDVAYKNGQLKDAIVQWHKASLLTKKPQLKESLKKAEDKAKKELKQERQARKKIPQKDKPKNPTN
ncbi:MAG: hypothetical protein WC394_05300 [Candidatus Omnitrophota bacterium]